MRGRSPADEPAPSAPQTAVDAATELLVEAGAVLAASLEPEVTMRQVAELTVPRLADLCVIDLLDEDGAIRGLAAVAADREIERGLVELRERFPLDPAGEHPVARVLRTGSSVLLVDMSSSMLESYARSPVHARFMIEHAYRSAVVAPLVARGRTLGALSVLRIGERMAFAESERGVVCELARRAALAIDNGRPFSELRMLEQRLEAILAGVAEAITVLDEHGRTVFANAAAAQLLGVNTPDELLGHPAGTIMRRFLVTDEDGRELALEQMPARRLLRGESAPAPLLVRNVVRESGEERWLIVRASAIVDPASGRMTHAVNVFENVTELKRTELAERLLADASRLLATVPPRTALDGIARMATQRLADWCAVDLVDDRGEVERAVTRSAPASTIRSDATGAPPSRPTLDDRDGIGAIIRAGRTQVWPAPATRVGGQPDEHIELLCSAGAAAVIVAPIGGVDGALGAMTLAVSRSRSGFARADVALAQELARRVGTALTNARRFRVRSRIADVLQQALLPQSLPLSDALEAGALYEAAGEPGEVGGDFYDMLEYDAGRWLVLIGDVCGKGAPAAGITALARHTLRAGAISGQHPAQMLETLHQALLRRASQPEPCTACLVLVAPGDRRAELTIALAGHHPPLVLGNGAKPRPVGRPGTLLGAVDPIRVHETPAELHEDETLLLYTDGVVDAGRPHRPLGEQGLIDLCARLPRGTLAELLEQIRSESVSHAGGSLRDDVALLALRLRTGGG